MLKLADITVGAGKTLHYRETIALIKWVSIIAILTYGDPCILESIAAFIH